MSSNSEADKKKLIPTINDHPQVVVQPYNSVSDLDLNPTGPEDVADGYVGMKDPVIRLSKNMQLSMRHVGFKERAIPVSEEWMWDESEGEAVPPVGREDSVYTQAETEKYSDYGTITIEKVAPFADDPSQELAENVVVTSATTESNDDEEMVEAIPVLAVNRAQSRHLTLEGRRGEAFDDPITNDNYLTRPGMEVATEDTYLSQIEESGSGSEDDNQELEPGSQSGENNSTPQTPEPTYTPVPEGAEFDSSTDYYTLVDGNYVKAEGLESFAEGVTYYTSSAPKVTKRTTRRTTKTTATK